MSSSSILTSDLLWVHPALDNFEAIGERVRSYFATPRPMVLIERFVNEKGPDELSIHRNLRLDTEGGLVEPLTVTIRDDWAGLVIHLRPGLHRVGFGTTLATSRSGQARWEKRRESGFDRDSITQVRFEGLGNSHRDTIEIETWNAHGVGHVSTLIFT